MDKLMIKELEKDISVRMAMAKGVAGSMNNGVEGWLGEYLIEKGWVKIPENAVVLTSNQKISMEHDWYRLGYEQGKKETAEKFSERLKTKLCEFFDDNEDNDGKIDKGICLIDVIGVESLDGEIISLGLIDEICKEITDKGVQNGD